MCVLLPSPETHTSMFLNEAFAQLRVRSLNACQKIDSFFLDLKNL